MLGDRDLEAYEVVIVDEAHERTLRTDMVLGFLKDVQSRRKAAVKEWKRKGKLGVERDGKEPKPLKIVVMSATIDAKRFSEFFNE
jgi:ATP-dependent RNA helicase DHX33